VKYGFNRSVLDSGHRFTPFGTPGSVPELGPRPEEHSLVAPNLAAAELLRGGRGCQQLISLALSSKYLFLSPPRLSFILSGPPSTP